MIDVDVQLHMYVYIYDHQKSLKGTLVDSPFQTLAVDFSSNLLNSSIASRSRNAFLVE